MSTESLLIVCDRPSHPKGRVAKIRTIRRVNGHWMLVPFVDGEPLLIGDTVISGNTKASALRNVAGVRTRFHLVCPLCGLDGQFRMDTLHSALDQMALAVGDVGQARVSLAELLAVVASKRT